MIEPVRIVLTEDRHYAAVRQQVPVRDLQKVMGPTLSEVLGVVLQQGLKPGHSWFTHHFHKPEKTFDFEVGVPLATAVAASGRVEPRVWPRMKVARTVYHGDYAGLPSAWMEFEKWVGANSRHPGTEFWEVYLVNPKDEAEPANWRTELNWPLLD